ncbi:hypothetical protein J5X84_17530 [Streptosporangiaceae bacterium NEAU-GS5]|nr:hypothetical protein [Streptosporangiaceae bacterium NEAU-GS5]
MDAESTICLSDMVPALRWSRPQQVADVLADPRMPEGWWGSVTLGRVLQTFGVEWLSDRLSRLATSRWDHLALTDVIPAIQVHSVDPALTGWPAPDRAMVSGLGGWHRLRRLTPADLRTPTTSPEAVLAIVFREILNHVRATLTERPPAEAAPAARPAAAPSMAPPMAPTTTTTGPFPAQPGIPTTTGPIPTPATTTGPFPAATTTGPLSAPVFSTDTPPRGMPAVSAVPPPPPPAPVPPPPSMAEHPMVALVDSVFRDWDPLAKAVAVDRLFAAEPVSLRGLAHRLNVDRELLSAAQRAAEERVLTWLRSPDSAALTGHLFGLTEWLGAAATQDQLIGADPSHPVEVPTLGTPLWRVLVTLMPDRRLQDGWLVVGDLAGLRERTRRMVASHSPDSDVIELLGQLGIRAHSAKAWLDAVPQGPSIPAYEEEDKITPLPRRTPGANGHSSHRNGVPIPSQANNGPDPATARAALNALSTSAQRPPLSPHLVPGPRVASSPASDPRRWQRIDVTSGHLRGEPVAVPENYAAQLGMRPGTLLSVTGPGDNAVVLVWRDRQPVFDSLQPVLMRLNARPGDAVYVTVDGYRLDAQITS